MASTRSREIEVLTAINSSNNRVDHTAAVEDEEMVEAAEDSFEVVAMEEVADVVDKIEVDVVQKLTRTR